MENDKTIYVGDILNAIKRLADWPHTTYPFKIYTSGTGIPDQIWIDFYKDTNQIIIARDGTEWRRGEKIE